MSGGIGVSRVPRIAGCNPLPLGMPTPSPESMQPYAVATGAPRQPHSAGLLGVKNRTENPASFMGAGHAAAHRAKGLEPSTSSLGRSVPVVLSPANKRVAARRGKLCAGRCTSMRPEGAASAGMASHLSRTLRRGPLENSTRRSRTSLHVWLPCRPRPSPPCRRYSAAHLNGRKTADKPRKGHSCPGGDAGG